MPRLKSLDEHDPFWKDQKPVKITKTVSALKLILIVFILLIAIGAVIKKATAEITHLTFNQPEKYHAKP